MKRKSHKRRNPSSHPILAALATMIVESAFNGLIFNVARRYTTPGLALSLAGVGSTVGGYVVGAHMFPKSKMPILVGSVIHSMLTPVVYALSGALNAPQLPAAPSAPQVEP